MSEKDKRPVLYTTRLVELRESRGLSKLQVAAGAGLSSEGAVEDAEAGYGIRLDTAIRLARFFELPIEVIWMPLNFVSKGVQ